MAKETRGQLGAALVIAGGALIVSSLCMAGCSGTKRRPRGRAAPAELRRPRRARDPAAPEALRRAARRRADGTATGGGTTGGTGGSGGTGTEDQRAARPRAPVDRQAAAVDRRAAPVSSDRRRGQTDRRGGPLPDAAGSSGCGAATWPASGNFNIDVAGTPRQYIVKVPAGYDTNRPYRLIFAWHGARRNCGPSGWRSRTLRRVLTGSTRSPAAARSSFRGKGSAPTAAAPVGRTPADKTSTSRARSVDWVKKNYCVDNARIFSVGHELRRHSCRTPSGARMGDMFRAIAPMSGSPTAAALCMGQVAVWISHGNGRRWRPFDARDGEPRFLAQGQPLRHDDDPRRSEPLRFVPRVRSGQARHVVRVRRRSRHSELGAAGDVWNFLSAL